ncbi:hypothetical protein [Microcoleus sp. herbarium14]
MNYLNKGDRTYDINLQIGLEIFCENAIGQMLLLPEIKFSGSDI